MAAPLSGLLGYHVSRRPGLGAAQPGPAQRGGHQGRAGQGRGGGQALPGEAPGGGGARSAGTGRSPRTPPPPRSAPSAAAAAAAAAAGTMPAVSLPPKENALFKRILVRRLAGSRRGAKGGWGGGGRRGYGLQASVTKIALSGSGSIQFSLKKTQFLSKKLAPSFSEA